MRAVIQRVRDAKVHIKDKSSKAITQGYLILLGYEPKDDIEDVKWLTSKVFNLRLFSDENNLMNLSIQDIKGEILCISQFTLHARTKKGNRPSFIDAAKPDISVPLYNTTIKLFKELMPNRVKTGEFGADMQVELTNDGPVTIILDSKNKL